MRDVFVPEITFRNRTELILFWFCGIAPRENLNKCNFVLTFSSTAMFSIWEHKLKKKKLTWALFKEDLLHYLGSIYDNNLAFRNSVEMLNLSICRNWDVLRGRRG